MEWSIVKELSASKLQGMIFKKQELSLSHHQFASYWRLSVGGTSQRELTEFNQLVERMKKSKVVNELPIPTFSSGFFFHGSDPGVNSLAG